MLNMDAEEGRSGWDMGAGPTVSGSNRWFGGPFETKGDDPRVVSMQAEIRIICNVCAKR